jgi:RHS repeat-associated protein
MMLLLKSLWLALTLIVFSASNRTSEQIDLTVISGSNNSLNQLTGLSGGGPVRVGGTVNQPSTVTVNGTAATTSGSAFTAQINLAAGTDTVSVVAKNQSGLSTTNNYHVTIPSASAGSTRTYQWDAANRLTAINNGTASSLFTYDGLGRRVKIVEETSGTVTSTKQLVWVGGDIAEERNASDTVTKRFYPQGEQIGSTSYYYTRDHLGSVRELTSNTSSVVTRYDYDPFGRETIVSGTVDSDFQYAGMYAHLPVANHAPDFNLTLFRAYDPNTARWLSRDPVDSNNLYAYGNNDPFNSVDPLGLCARNSLGGTGDPELEGPTVMPQEQDPLFWKNVAANARRGEYSEADLASMRAGRAPVYNAAYAKIGGAEGPAAVRAAYEAEVRALEDQGLAARAAGQDAETTARQLVDARNALKVAARAQSPADAVAQMEARNMAKYGNPVGPTADQLHAAGKTWEQIIESASRPGGGDLGF